MNIINNLLNFLNESIYLGSCVDVGNSKKHNYINNIFSDATDMSYYVYDPNYNDMNNSMEISKDDFLKEIDINIIDKKVLKGDVKFCYIPSLKIFYIYNFDKDIYYFYK